MKKFSKYILLNLFFGFLILLNTFSFVYKSLGWELPGTISTIFGIIVGLPLLLLGLLTGIIFLIIKRAIVESLSGNLPIYSWGTSRVTAGLIIFFYLISSAVIAKERYSASVKNIAGNLAYYGILGGLSLFIFTVYFELEGGYWLTPILAAAPYGNTILFTVAGMALSLWYGLKIAD